MNILIPLSVEINRPMHPALENLNPILNLNTKCFKSIKVIAVNLNQLTIDKVFLILQDYNSHEINFAIYRSHYGDLFSRKSDLQVNGFANFCECGIQTGKLNCI